MPCVDGREREGEERRQRDIDALSALLCGVLDKKSSRVQELADEWFWWHQQLDVARRERPTGQFNLDHAREYRDGVSRVLAKAHKELCT